jgi:pyruvate dehydrogenase E2 component (dihydrolipoamide acetyltransferase)
VAGPDDRAGDGPAPAAAAPATVPAAAVRRPASPAARRLARELGVDLGGVAGSGPGGRIVEADVRAAGAATRPAATLSPMRRAIAGRLTRALATAAQLTLMGEADVTALAAAAGPGARPPYTAAAVRAMAVAAARHPAVRRRWSDDGLVDVAAIDVGVAVALPDGLLAPTVRGADRKDVAAIAEEVAALATRARRGELSAAGGDGAALGVTSLGAHRVDAFTPLLDPSQTALLGVGRARPRPAVVDGAIVVRDLMALSLTFDHRVLDGDPAAAFLDDVIGLLEHPEALAAVS